jgi:hypothetical protein
LAHLDAVEVDHVNNLLREQNKCCRHTSDNRNGEWAAPRKRTTFPGQHARCWYCGRHYVWGGNGVTENLMCSGSREWRCWNSIGFNGESAIAKIVAAITSELYKLDGFDDQFREMVAAATEAGGVALDERRRQLLRDADALKRQEENLTAAILEYGPRPMFTEKLGDLEKEKLRIEAEQKQIERRSRKRLSIPGSVKQLRELTEQQFVGLSRASSDFGELMKNLVPQFDVHLVRLCDGGHLLPRAKVTVSLTGLVPDATSLSDLTKAMMREFTFDLFDPPQRERIRAEVVGLNAKGVEQRDIAAAIAEKPTQTAVYRALRLEKQMRQLNLTSPYLPVLEPPEDYSKLQRPKNARYRFEMKKGYDRPPLE